MHPLLLENFQFGQENKVDNSQRFPLYFFLKAAFSKEDFFMLYLITLALKKVMKTWDCEKPNKTRAKKVVIPPLMMAGPILFKLLTARSSLVPGKERKKILDNRVVEDSKAQYKTKTWIIPSKIQQIQSKNPWWTYFSKVLLIYGVRTVYFTIILNKLQCNEIWTTLRILRREIHSQTQFDQPSENSH